MYSLGEEQLNISAVGMIMTYSMEWKKDKLELFYSYQPPGGNNSSSQKLKLSKKK